MFFSSACTANELPSATSVALVSVPLWLDVFVAIDIYTSCEFFGTIFVTAGKIPFINFSINNVPSRTKTFTFLTVSNKMCTRVSSIRT